VASETVIPILIEIVRLGMLLAGGFGLLFLWGWHCWHGKPLHQQGGSGTIAPARISATIFMTCAVGLVVVGLLEAATGSWLGGPLLVSFGLYCAACSVPYFTRSLDVIWNEDGIQGPRPGWRSHFRIPRTFIRWDDIAAYGHWSVRARDGRRIFWGINSGLGALVEELRRHRPELTLVSPFLKRGDVADSAA
jgi:hypothetical protein